MDFKAQALKDMAVFHNTAEFAEPVTLYYDGVPYAASAVLSGTDRPESVDKNSGAPLSRSALTAHIPLEALGFAPRRGCSIELSRGSAPPEPYVIEESTLLDGEIILELEALGE